MKASAIMLATSLAGTVFAAASPAAAQSCLSTCNAANDKCSSAGRDDTVCLNAWHQCRVGCNTPRAAPAKLQVSRPAPGTVVIKTVAPAKKK